MRKHYLEQAAAFDTNVEARIEREAFDFRIFLLEAASRRRPISFLREQGVSLPFPVIEEELRTAAWRSMK